MIVKAKIRSCRITARKARLVRALIVGQSVEKANIILDNVNKRAVPVFKKLLIAAIANAVNNNGLNADQLFIKYILVNEGRTLKRLRPGSHGRGWKILKRSSAIEIGLVEKPLLKSKEDKVKTQKTQIGKTINTNNDSKKVLSKKVIKKQQSDGKIIKSKKIKKPIVNKINTKTQIKPIVSKTAIKTVNKSKKK